MAQTDATEKKPFTKADAVGLWNTAGGFLQELEPRWGRHRKRREIAARGPAGGLALTFFDHDKREDTRYDRHVQTAPPEGQPFPYAKSEEVTARDALGTAAIIATLTDRPVALEIDHGVSMVVRPGESPDDAMARLAPPKVAVDDVGGAFLGNPHWQS